MDFKRQPFHRKGDLTNNIFLRDEDSGYANQLNILDSQIQQLEATPYKGSNGLYDELIARKKRLLEHINGNNDEDEGDDFDDDPEQV